MDCWLGLYFPILIQDAILKGGWDKRGIKYKQRRPEQAILH